MVLLTRHSPWVDRYPSTSADGQPAPFTAMIVKWDEEIWGMAGFSRLELLQRHSLLPAGYGRIRN